METLVHEVGNRTTLGKKVKSLRREGITPANIFGHGIDSVSIQSDTNDIEKLISKAGRTRMITLKNPDFKRDCRVLIKGINRDAISGALLHVDFYQVSMKDKLKVDIPLAFHGEAPASRRKDLVLLETMNSVEVECLPADIPENIMVDISELAEAGDHVLVGALIFGEKVTVITNAEDIIAKVDHVKAAEMVEEAEVAEGEALEAGEAEAGAPAEGTPAA
ncbi:MAG: 50S ribosomal protein L25 [Chloroflexi bacterium]|jgi:large subunit ribosomal protein L25|nr:50S ribosomal protein L25 [Chloroflexota bacterium]